MNEAENKPIFFEDKLRDVKELLKDGDIFVLLSAVRGNDYGLGHIKFLFTARIRYFLDVNPVYAIVREHKHISKFDATCVLDDIETAKHIRMNTHYFDHVINALRTLRHWELMDSDEFDVLHTLAVLIYTYMLGAEVLESIKINLNKLVDELQENLGENQGRI